MLTLEQAKAYLRVDSAYEDVLIQSLALSSEALCREVARLSADDWEALESYGGEGTLVVHGEEKNTAEVESMRALLRVASLYTLGYLYEHREEADHHDLTVTLRNLLFSVREGL